MVVPGKRERLAAAPNQLPPVAPPIVQSQLVVNGRDVMPLIFLHEAPAPAGLHALKLRADPFTFVTYHSGSNRRCEPVKDGAESCALSVGDHGEVLPKTSG